MDLHSDNESQPTQLIQEMLTRRSGDVDHNMDWEISTRNLATDDSNSTKDFSVNGMAPPVRTSAPQYHLHGLAPTQIESQYEAPQMGLQDEGVPAANGIKRDVPVRTRSSSPHVLPVGASNKGSHNDPFSHPHPRTGIGAAKTQGVKAVSFQSPRKETNQQLYPTKSMSIHPRYNRSPSPASQDSFGGGVSQDPQQQFLASSKQFDVPLARLGHDSAEDRAVDLDDTTSAPNDEEVSFLSLARQAYSAQKASEPSIDYAHTDTVLVAATPSHSGGSEGSSQYSRFVESQTRDRFSGHFDHDTDHHSQESTQPFDFDQPTSSLDRLLDKELEESAARQAAYPDLSALDPTQPTDLEPTQPTEELPATQPDDTNPVDDDMVQDPETNSPSWVYPAAPSVVTSSAPRSLISMVHPHQKHRIEQLRQLQKNAILKDPLPSRAVQDVAAETELSRAEESHLGPTSEPAPIKKPTPPPLRRVDRRHLARNQATSENDALEIIPDSEPLRAVRGTTPVHENPLQRPINGSPTKRPFKPISPMSEHASGELVPDSIEMEEGSGGSDQGDDDDDIPLVSVLANKGLSTNVGHKDKVTTIQTMSSAAEPSKTVSKLPKPPVSSTKATTANKGPSTSSTKPKSTTKSNTRRSGALGTKNKSEDSREIPTSAPEQDLLEKSSKKPRLPSADSARSVPLTKQTKSKASSTTTDANRRSRSTSAASNLKKRHLPSDTESSEEWEHHTAEDDDRRVPRLEEEEEEETDPPDANGLDVELPVNNPPPRKKRRITDVKVERGTSRATTKASKQSGTPVPPTRSTAKRLRSVMSASKVGNQPATRVFALWKQDGHYYSGTVHSQHSSSSTRYLVKFDDGTEDTVDISKMRQCEVMIGDNVILVEGNVKGKVVGYGSSGAIQVEIDDGASLAISDVEIRELMIASRTLISQWKERMLSSDSIIPIIRPKPLQTSPSPSKLSIISATSVKGGRKSLAKTGFVITLSVGSKNPDQEKDNINLAIKNNGGVVLDDWSSVFSMQGTHIAGNKRWVATQKDLRWLRKDGIERVFLLSDDSSQKSKFLIALALGIPCISVEWVRQEVPSEWQPFLLPAGFSEPLNARISQLIDMDWGNSLEHVTEIMSNLAASKLFTDKSILCLGAEFVPTPKSRKASSVDGTLEASRSVPWIILAMGASRVEAAFDLKSASSKNLQSFDYVVVKDNDEAVENLRESDVTLVHVPWIKQCLIAGRLLPIEW